MEKEDRQRLIDAGAAARAAGLPFRANPAYLHEQQPEHTGEPVSDWLDRVYAWHVGWELENSLYNPETRRQIDELLRAMRGRRRDT